MRDYAKTGLTIQQAMVDFVRRHPKQAKKAPPRILWDKRSIQTSDRIVVPERGTVRLEFVSPPNEPRQGFDIRAEGGFLVLPSGEHVGTLRTWHEPHLENVVQYAYECSGILRVWNVYEMHFPRGVVRAEHWTENAGFWTERTEENTRVYHCSPGQVQSPDFESLIVTLSWRSSD